MSIEEKDGPVKGIERKYSQGSIIMHQGQPTAAFHTIVSGQVDVLVGVDPQVRVSTLGPGEFFGEMACLTGDPVSATIVAVSPVITMEMNKDELLQLLDSDRSLRNRLITELVNRVSKSNIRVHEENLRTRVMTKIMCSESEALYGELIGQSEALKKIRSDIKQWGASPAPVAITGESGTGKRHIAARLHYESPRCSAPLIFINGVEFTRDGWEMKLKAAGDGTVVINRADYLPAEVIKNIVSGSQSAKIIITAEELPEILGLTRLPVPPLREHKEDIPALARFFLKQAGATDPVNILTSEALRRLIAYPYLAGNINELFHVLEQALILSAGMPISPEHLRLGKYKKAGSRPLVGLALGGGAVRGMAHVGVLKVLEEEGIPIDFIAGSSVGAVVGCIYAAGMPVTEMEKIIMPLRWSNLVKPIWPRLALCENSRMGTWLQKQTGCKEFKDLQIPFSCVAADALTGEAVVLQSGCLLKAIRASTAIPLMMAPVYHQGRTLVDGAVLHKVPAAIVRSMGADLVIAVDVTGPANVKSQPRHLLDALFSVLDTMSQHMLKEELEWADIVLCPQAPLSGYSFDNTAAFLELGKKVTRENTDHIRKRFGEMAEAMA